MSALVLPIIALLAFVVESAAGFGATVVMVSIGSQFHPVEDVIAALLPVNLALSAFFVIRDRDAVDWRLLGRRVLAWMGPGMALGMLLFRLRDAGGIRTAFAAFVLFLSVIELNRARAATRDASEARALSPVVAGSALFGAGLVHGLFACGGPLLVYVAGREILDKKRFRATLSAVWLVLNLVLLTSYALSGLVSPRSLGSSASLIVSLAAGSWLGDRLHGKLSPERFRVAVFALLLVAASALLYRSLFA